MSFNFPTNDRDKLLNVASRPGSITLYDGRHPPPIFVKKWVNAWGAPLYDVTFGNCSFSIRGV